MKLLSIRCVLMWFVLWAAHGGSSASAQSYSIDWHTIDGGGGTSSGGPYSMSGTIGQAEAGGAMTGGAYSLTGGFWSVFAVQTLGAPKLSIVAVGLDARIEWNPASPGFVLQVSTNLASPSWLDAPTGTTNPTLVPATGPSRFYRLRKP